MNIYLTSGTMDFMETVRKRYMKETMVAMHGTGNSVLLHETEGKTVFQTPRRYEVISAVGTIEEEGYFALNNIPVTDEGRPIFEHRFQSEFDSINEEPGFVAFRLLRPLNSDTYVILTQWSNEIFFNSWKNSTTYKQAYESIVSGAGNKMAHIFSSAAYVTTYKTKKEEEEDEEI